jgi:N-acetyl-anhydromuramoyl-L-alanine amidase
MDPTAEPRNAAVLWDRGWYRFAHRCPSPNFGPRPEGVSIELLVLHSISLPPGHYGGNAVAELFTNQLDWNAHPYYQTIKGMQVSAHFFVRRNGDLWQFVSAHDRAWHAGTSYYQGRHNCNDHSIGIELEGLEGDQFEQAQYETLLSLLPALAQQFPILHLAGHEHIAPGRKSDPGPGFRWDVLRRDLGLPDTMFPERHSLLDQ